MWFLSYDFFLTCFIGLLTLLISIITFYKWRFTYWKKRNVPFETPSIPFGSNNIFGNNKSQYEDLQRQYAKFKSDGYKHFGMFSLATPGYIPIDVEVIKNMLTKDFDYFPERGWYVNERDDLMTATMFALPAAKWRGLRMKLTPTFTSGKMKMMFPIMVQCANQLNDLMSELSAKEAPVEIKDVMSRFTTDVIGSCAFGIECNSCKDPDSVFRKHGKRIFTLTKMEMMRAFIAFSAPGLAKRLRMNVFPRESTEFFMKIISDTFDYREKNGVVRNDFVQLLLDLKNSENGTGLTIRDLGAQAMLFFLAGYETSSTTLAFALYELSQNQEIQQKSRDEVNTILEKHKEITYEAIHDMKYLGQVMDETLRKYPPLGSINRMCVKDYMIPNSDLVIKKGTPILIPVLGLQKDEEYFPSPEEFNPERFSEENKSSIKPFTYLPFGDGPRVCLGLRFGVMQTKLGLAMLLKNYKFTLNPKTEVPLEMEPFSITMRAKNDILLDVTKL